MWIILTIISVVSLIIFWGGKNAVWGGLTIGVFGGIIVSVVSVIIGNDFYLTTIGKVAVIGTLVGVVAELIGRLSTYFKKKKDYIKLKKHD